MVAVTPASLRALDVVRSVGIGGGQKVFGLSKSQIARRVKAIARAAGLADWEFFSGHSGRVGMARRMAQERRPHPRDRTPGPLEAGRRHGGATPAAKPPGRPCGTYNAVSPPFGLTERVTMSENEPQTWGLLPTAFQSC